MSYDKVVPIILAGKRKEDPLSNHFAVDNKAFIELNNKPMINWVSDALKDSKVQEPFLLSITDNQQNFFEEKLKNCSHKYEFIINKPDDSPVRAAVKALNHLNEDQSLLVTTADNPLLSKKIISYFIDECQSSGADLVIGVVNGQEKLVTKLPHIKRTWHKINKSTWLSGANLFYWSKKNSKSTLNEVLVKLETQRKNPLAFTSTVAEIDFVFLIKYFLEMSSLEECQKALSKAIGIKVKLLALPFPEACIDVDKLEDYELVQKIMNRGIIF